MLSSKYFVTILYHSRTLRISTQDVHILIIFILKYFYLSLNRYFFLICTNSYAYTSLCMCTRIYILHTKMRMSLIMIPYDSYKLQALLLKYKQLDDNR